MELRRKLLEQTVFKTRPEREEHMLIVMMYKSTYAENFSQPLQTETKQLTIAITFLTGYNSTFRV